MTLKIVLIKSQTIYEDGKKVFLLFPTCGNCGKGGKNHKYSHLSFLTRITDMMTSRLPKMAAMIINIIMKAEKTVIKTLIHSWSVISSVLLLGFLIVEFEIACATISLIVWIFSVVNDEEDDNLGVDVSDDMFAYVSS